MAAMGPGPARLDPSLVKNGKLAALVGCDLDGAYPLLCHTVGASLCPELAGFHRHGSAPALSGGGSGDAVDRRRLKNLVGAASAGHAALGRRPGGAGASDLGGGSKCGTALAGANG